MNKANYFLTASLLLLLALSLFAILLFGGTNFIELWKAMKFIFLPMLLMLSALLILMASVYLFLKAIQAGKPKRHVRFL